MVVKLKILRCDVKDTKTKTLIFRIIEHAYDHVLKSPEANSLKLNTNRQQLVTFITDQLSKAKEEDYIVVIAKDPSLAIKIATNSLIYI